ncbi:hypothetical protein AGABI1DRAFT_114424 [Agaricus bisporus var. burnettii JB137-S8]|uniref:G-protein coupled receptors family 1 profile domain-containing protein n=1 Tax=Agaricus bisporus var. burnettii (strain JB137-S8 / ATCC MYA-4627 / FGSC 10392) TaxID=597362 RepID=K5X6L2_AGABU|nr:uncharacterized protein AGABI1DRAFT_114424 [Agaricus bisporus var. burnettii JB137-S8]EKM78848.1 hypothetical protein AGABI1DRAFT_114424 [Agaricus bisporus var. burnettii JB137-S8]
MFISIVLLVMTIVPPLFSPHVVRRKTWHTLMLSMLVFAIGEILLVGQQTTDFPNHGLCLVQVGIIQATPPLIGTAMAAYVIDIYVSIRRMFMSDNWEDGPESRNEIILLFIPWIVLFLVFFETVLVVGLPGDQLTLSTPHYYCRTLSRTSIIVSVVLVVLTGVIAIGVQAATAWMLYKNWLREKKWSITSTMRKYIHAFIRTITFTVIALMGMGLGVAIISTADTVFTYVILLPFVPLGAVAIFGTYKDIMSFYVFWK